MGTGAGTGHSYAQHSEEGELHVWGGIVSARVSDLAAALETTPEQFLETVGREDVTPLVDTAEPKGRGKDRDQPTSPEKRCMAFNVEDFEALADLVDEREAVPA